MRDQNRISTPYERIVNTPRITYFMLLITTITSLVIAVIFVIYHRRIDATVISILAVTALSLFLFWAQQTGYYRFAGLVQILLISGVLTFNIGLGHGIFDEGMLAYPLIIVFSSLLFGKSSVIISTTITTIEITLIYILSRYGFVQPFNGNITMKLEETVTTLIILVVTGLILYIVVDIIEKTVEKIIDSEVELESSYDLTLRAWAMALELRGREVPGHCERVTRLSVEIGQQLGFGPEQINQIRRGALLHDIGKMGIPEKILLKPGALTKEEWEIVSKHPQMALEIFQDISYLQDALSVVGSHHEAIDGTGYPNCLRGEQIPASSRAFTIVDNWDMLRSDRPYSPAWTDQQAADYIQEQAGKKFDPQMVEAFFTLLADSAKQGDNQ